MAVDLFNIEFSGEHFEDRCKQNGFTYWMASDLQVWLGYETWSSFQKAISKAMTTCTTLNIPVFDNFTEVQGTTVNGRDFKLSRFACYLIAMNADNKKEPVAKAQAYFATLAGSIDSILLETQNVERLIIRDEITERETSLSSIVHRAGIDNYPYFQNAGYRGMYNKNISQLKKMRGVDDKRSLLDFMGKDELAANLFRITQTELKVKKEDIRGQSALEAAHQSVGRKVRATMIDISGIKPEELPKHEDLKEVKKGLKVKNKSIKAIDNKSKKKK